MISWEENGARVVLFDPVVIVEARLTSDPSFSADSGFLGRYALNLWPKVYGYGMSLTGDPHRAEDLCQEAYLRLFSMKRPVDGSRSLLPLLLTIVRNLVRTEERRPHAKSFEEAGGTDEALADPKGLEPAQRVSHQEAEDAVKAALHRLNPLWRSVLYLRDGLGFSYREIAAVVDRSEDSVRVALHRARQKTRDMLKGFDHSQERRAQ